MFEQQRANGRANVNVAIRTCQRQRANRNVPTATCQRKRANGNVPTATCQRQRANGNVSTATCQRQRANCSDQNFRKRCYIFKIVWINDSRFKTIFRCFQWLLWFFVVICRFSNKFDVETSIRNSHASGRRYLFSRFPCPILPSSYALSVSSTFLQSRY